MRLATAPLRSGDRFNMASENGCNALALSIRECGSTLYVGMAQGVSFSLYIGIGAKFENTQKTGERRLRTASLT